MAGAPFYIFAALFILVWVGAIMARQRFDGKCLDVLPWIRKCALRPLLYLAALGLVLSIAVHVASLFGIPVSDEAIWLHFGIFVVFVPGMLLHGRKDPFSSLPKWATRLFSVLFVYTFVNFFYFVSHTPPRGTPKNDPRQPTQAQKMRGASGHWMLFYAAGFGMIWNARRADRTGIGVET